MDFSILPVTSSFLPVTSSFLVDDILRRRHYDNKLHQSHFSQVSNLSDEILIKNRLSTAFPTYNEGIHKIKETARNFQMNTRNIPENGKDISKSSLSYDMTSNAECGAWSFGDKRVNNRHSFQGLSCMVAEAEMHARSKEGGTSSGEDSPHCKITKRSFLLASLLSSIFLIKLKINK